MGGTMNIQDTKRELFNAMYDHRTVTLSLTRDRSVMGRISGISDIAVKLGLTPSKYFRIDQIKHVKLH